MPDLYIFKTQVGMFDPIALQNQNVAIHYNQSTYYRKVDFLESIPPFQCIDIAAGVGLGALAASARVNIVNLEMADNEFGLWRWYPIDDAQIRLYHPAGLAKFQLRNLQVPVDMNILFRDPNLVSTEIAVWEDNRPGVEAINGNAVALGAARLVAIGYRFHTLEIEGVMTQKEKEVLSQMKLDPQNRMKKDKDLLIQAFKEERLPITHVWCSGRAMGE